MNIRLLYRRCAGLDVHKKTVHACIRIRASGSKQATVETAVFGTFTEDLEHLRQWLRQHKVKQVAMESTGVYWIPVWNVLERGERKLELVLVNPQQVRALPGRKTDQQDCDRIAELLQYGLLRGSFIPPPPIRELRALTRRRVHLQGDRNRVINRIGRLLETVNLKLGSVASNIVGKTGRLILKQIAGGVTDPERLADLAQGKLRDKKQELALSLKGFTSEHFRWLLGELIEELEGLDKKLELLDRRIASYAEPHADLIRRLCTIPGVDRVTAWTLVAELGTDMSVFPDAAHAASWAGLCPGNQQSAGKRQSGRTRKGDRYLRRMLIQNAWAVIHKKNCFLTALFYRVASRRGLKRAAMAVAHRILTIAYLLIRDGSVYREIGDDFYDRQHPERTARRLTQRLERIGYEVLLTARTTVPEQQPEPQPKRGRPCKCVERGLACTHTGGRSSTSRSSTGRSSTGRSSAGRSVQPPRTVGYCSRCAKWGIPCIHARNALHTPPPPPFESTT